MRLVIKVLMQVNKHHLHHQDNDSAEWDGDVRSIVTGNPPIWTEGLFPSALFYQVSWQWPTVWPTTMAKDMRGTRASGNSHSEHFRKLIPP